jgi:CheY-like chemotaxis protein
LGTLAGGIAHDFNNLLGGVLGQAELALAECTAGLYPENELKVIRNVAIRGSEIVRQLMVYAGKECETDGLVDASWTVQEMLELLKVSVSKHATLESRLGQDHQAVRGSSAQLQQIVMNLVMNASEAIGDRDGIIRVTTRCVNVGRDSSRHILDRLPPGDYVQLEVSDTGCGMSEETQARIFDPFFTTKSGGHGLGLAVVDGIVRGLHGAIYVVSEPTKGTSFQVLMPRVEHAAGPVVGPIAASMHFAPANHDITVLVVDDEDPLRQSVVRMLRKKGFTVLEAGNGSSAVNILRGSRGKIDLVLLDMTIPGASSAEILAEAARTRPEARVILTSAYSQNMLKLPMNGHQIRGFIRKPFQFSDLLKTLCNTLLS